MNDIFTHKISQDDIIVELNAIGFDKTYLNNAKDKYKFSLHKILNLTSVEANILKQTALSVGTDCAVHRNVINCKIEYSDCILGGSVSQLKKIITKLKRQPFRLNSLGLLLEKELELNLPQITLRDKEFNLQDNKYIMGILNITPDSFSDGGMYYNISDALKRTETMLSEGADIIDIGAESTAPANSSISVKEEQKRLLPVLKEIRKNFPEIVISVDTRNSKTALLSVEYGADIINDISGGSHCSDMFDTIAKLNVPYILTNYTYDKNRKIIDDVYEDLYTKIQLLINKGLNKNNIIADVGIGFGKNSDDNFKLLSDINDFTSLGCPLLVGHSRKSFLSNTLNIKPSQLDSETAAISLLLFFNNVNFLRVHNIKRTSDIIKIYKVLKNKNTSL